MEKGKTYIVKVSLAVKAFDPGGAKEHVRDRLLTTLNNWFCEGPLLPPYMNGELIHYGVSEAEEF